MSSSETINCKKHLVGKVIIVTGANTGIGFMTAKELAQRGARVILGCRNQEKGTTARDSIIAATGNNDVHFKHLDLASLTSVRTFADDIIKNEKQLDILINNAGIIETNHVKTEDGLSLIMQSNHFGPFLLTSLLLPLLKTSAPSRIVNVSSVVYSSGKIDFDNLNFEKDTEKSFNMIKAYENTKLCNVLMTLELARRLEGTGVTANCLHPGVVATDLLITLKKSWWRYFIPLMKPFMKTPWEGAQTSIFLAASPKVEGVTGKYYVNCRESNLAARARDKDVARKLWELSEKLVGLKE